MTRTAAPRAVARPAKRLSAALSALCLAFAVVLPVLSLALLALEPELLTEGLGLPASSADSAASTFSAIQRVLIVVIGFVPIAFMTYALVCAHRCFKSFARGDYFTLRVVRSLRGLAAGIALWTIAGGLTQPLLGVLLTLAEEELSVSVSFGTSGLFTLLFAGIVWQIADIMTKAVALAEENAQFV
ncbi:MAG TPA: DUF2975 domain-containing protein [Gammaproteobacteria bacterium]